MNFWSHSRRFLERIWQTSSFSWPISRIPSQALKFNPLESPLMAPRTALVTPIPPQNWAHSISTHYQVLRPTTIWLPAQTCWETVTLATESSSNSRLFIPQHPMVVASSTSASPLGTTCLVNTQWCTMSRPSISAHPKTWQSCPQRQTWSPETWRSFTRQWQKKRLLEVS